MRARQLRVERARTGIGVGITVRAWVASGTPCAPPSGKSIRLRQGYGGQASKNMNRSNNEKALCAKPVRTPVRFLDSSFPQATPPRRAVWGLLDRKERWSLSWRGWLMVVFALVLTGRSDFQRHLPFSCDNHRVKADVLVVEGWVHEYAIRAAAEEFRSGSYRRVFTTGGPVEELEDTSMISIPRPVWGRTLKKSGPGKRIGADGSFPRNGSRQNIRVGGCAAELVS